MTYVIFFDQTCMKIVLFDEKDIDESQTVWLSGCPYKTKAKKH